MAVNISPAKTNPARGRLVGVVVGFMAVSTLPPLVTRWDVPMGLIDFSRMGRKLIWSKQSMTGKSPCIWSGSFWEGTAATLCSPAALSPCHDTICPQVLDMHNAQGFAKKKRNPSFAAISLAFIGHKKYIWNTAWILYWQLLFTAGSWAVKLGTVFSSPLLFAAHLLNSQPVHLRTGCFTSITGINKCPPLLVRTWKDTNRRVVDLCSAPFPFYSPHRSLLKPHIHVPLSFFLPCSSLSTSKPCFSHPLAELLSFALQKHSEHTSIHPQTSIPSSPSLPSVISNDRDTQRHTQPDKHTNGKDLL